MLGRACSDPDANPDKPEAEARFKAIGAAHAAVQRRAEEIGWHDRPRPGPASVTVYEVLRS